MKPIKRKVLLSDSHLCARERVCLLLISSQEPVSGPEFCLVSIVNGQRNVVVGLIILIFYVSLTSASALLVSYD